MKNTELIEVKIGKSEIPIIWIDTSIISNMTQWKYKLCSLSKIQEKRISDLYNAILKFTRKKKLICPFSEQEEEIWIERNKWLEIMNTLSLGIKTFPLGTIEEKQMYIFMKSYVNNSKTVSLFYKDIFLSDPIKELYKKSRQTYYVTIKFPILFGEDKVKENKTKLNENLEKQRQANVRNKITFDQQLENEYTGGLSALYILQNKFFKREFVDQFDDYNSYCGVQLLNQQLYLWETLVKKSKDYAGLELFYNSDYYKSMPRMNISCKLYAKLMTNKQPIKSGDYMDLHHASSILPYVDMYITDKAMSHLLRSYMFDELYNTKICYIGDTRRIFDFFSSA